MKIREITKEETWPIRQKVMWPTKPINFVKLKEDEIGKHYGLFMEEELISVVSLFIKKDNAQFRKFATLEKMQRKGYGGKLLSFLFEQANQAGVNRIWCNARKSKVSFYEKFGMCETNEQFEKEGISYVIMEKLLRDEG